MTRECRYCSSGRVVPVLQKRIERSPSAGNKYRLFCQECAKWLHFCGEADFKQSLHPHVLPVDGDTDEPAEHIVPLEDYDYSEEWADVVEQATGDRPQARTDGGHPEESDEEEEQVEEVVNRFECPGCSAIVEGYPDKCPDCSAPYNW